MKKGFSGLSFTVNDHENPKINPDPSFDLLRVKSQFNGGFGEDCLHYGLPGGGNSGYQAVNLAFLLGAGTVLLLGFDMQGDHYFGKHPDGLVQNSPFDGFMRSFETVREKEIINCSRRTAMTCLRRASLESVLSSVQAQASRGNSSIKLPDCVSSDAIMPSDSA